MIQYILECIGFQLAFLIIYDFFLKRETFFQWNRVYLIGTYILSLALPWVKIEALRTTVPEDYYVYPEFLWNANALEFTAETADNTIINFSWQQGLLYGGMMVAALYFAYKLVQLYQLSKNGNIEHFPKFTRIVIKNSELAFSFFRSIFLGDKILEREHSSIIKHELVHIEQRHTLDLLFFELMRIVGWFNPLVYVYQNRISELHEFIADAQVPKAERKAHYDLLLSQIFKTQNISFVNQFFKSSLIKKRIVMLQKSKSKKVFHLKYLLLLPLVFGMLAYTSSSLIVNKNPSNKSVKLANTLQQKNDFSYVEPIPFAEVEHVPVFPDCENDADTRGCFFENMRKHIRKHFNYPQEAQERGIQGRVNTMFIIDEVGNIIDAKFRGPDSLLTNEAERIISRLPKMQPGQHKGQKVQVAFSIPITFKLNANRSKEATPQKDYDNESYVPFAVIDEVPVFPGCEDAEDKRACFNQNLQKHISKNFQYPIAAQEKGIQGMVNVIFTIGADGVVKNLRMRGPDRLLEDEAKRMIDLLPQMIPGKQKGKKVDVPYSIPISFRLESEINQTAGWKLDSSIKKEKSLDDDKNPLFLVDGKEYTKQQFMEFERVNADNIKFINVIKDKNAGIEKYGVRGRNGVVEVVTNSNSKLEVSGSSSVSGSDIRSTGNGLNEKPIYMLNGEETTLEYVNTIVPDDIATMMVLKGKAAIDKYGEKAADGVVEIILKKKD